MKRENIKDGEKEHDMHLLKKTHSTRNPDTLSIAGGKLALGSGG